jgi:hypothetical protein
MMGVFNQKRYNAMAVIKRSAAPKTGKRTKVITKTRQPARPINRKRKTIDLSFPPVRQNVGARNLRVIAARRIILREFSHRKSDHIAVRKRFRELISTPNLKDLMKVAFDVKMQKDPRYYEKLFDPMHGSLVYQGLSQATKKLAAKSKDGMYDEYVTFFDKFSLKSGTAAIPDICPQAKRSANQSAIIGNKSPAAVNTLGVVNAGYEFNDPVQGCLGNCWLIAAFSSYAWASTYNGAVYPNTKIKNPIKVTSLNLGKKPITSNMSFYLDTYTNYPYYARTNLKMLNPAEPKYECWPSLYEKCFALYYENRNYPFNTSDPPNYPGIDFGSAYTALTEFTQTTSSFINTVNYLGTSPATADISGMTTLIKTNVCGISSDLTDKTFYPAMRPTVTDTYFSEVKVPQAANNAGYTPATVVYNCPGLPANHTYSILGLYRDGDTYVVLRNPWGYDGKIEAFNTDLQKSLATSLTTLPAPANIADTGSEGIFGLKMITFMRYFEKLGWI